MKREFLQNLKVGDMPLSKEVIDAIMEENGKDINGAKASAVKPYADYEALKAENETLKSQQEGSLAEGKTAQQWKEAYDRAARDYEKHLAGVTFQNALDSAILSCGGRNTKAISALLDLEALQNSEDRSRAIDEALKKLKAEDGYLFADQTPPPYARGTGTQNNHYNPPTGLAGALREKFERK